MQKWEYRTQVFSFARRYKMSDELTVLGARGWEAVSIARMYDRGDVRDSHLVLLKRRVREADDA